MTLRWPGDLLPCSQQWTLPVTPIPSRRYDTVRRVQAGGNFVLCICEGAKNSIYSGIYDLFHVEAGRIVEHWNIIEAIPLHGEWKNNNREF
ncbi:MAG: hypothetical protein GY761_13820 [Hyphomicrobiales bacterium]|nr:hypothetical protein [Hyphomicrobiales bacterium]